MTHDLGLAARMDRQIELLDGRIVADESNSLSAQAKRAERRGRPQHRKRGTSGL